MGALDGLIQPILFVCFAVYVIMGITLVAMGAVYMAETGAAGATGGSLLFIGDSDSPPPARRPVGPLCREPCVLRGRCSPPATTDNARGAQASLCWSSAAWRCLPTTVRTG